MVERDDLCGLNDKISRGIRIPFSIKSYDNATYLAASQRRNAIVALSQLAALIILYQTKWGFAHWSSFPRPAELRPDPVPGPSSRRVGYSHACGFLNAACARP